MKSDYRPVRTVAAAELPVTLDEAKRHLAVTFPDHDALITGLLEAAVAHLDGWAGILGRCMVSQTWRQDFTGWPGSRVLRLAFPDVSEVTLTYFDTDNVEQTVAASNYEVLEDHASSIVCLNDSFSAPSLYSDRKTPVRVSMVVGYGDAADVPQALKTAILMITGHLYEHREDVVVGVSAVEMPKSSEMFITPYRRVGV